MRPNPTANPGCFLAVSVLFAILFGGMLLYAFVTGEFPSNRGTPTVYDDTPFTFVFVYLFVIVLLAFCLFFAFASIVLIRRRGRTRKRSLPSD